jgi:hypothetical protein
MRVSSSRDPAITAQKLIAIEIKINTKTRITPNERKERILDLVILVRVNFIETPMVIVGNQLSTPLVLIISHFKNSFYANKRFFICHKNAQ